MNSTVKNKKLTLNRSNLRTVSGHVSYSPGPCLGFYATMTKLTKQEETRFLDMPGVKLNEIKAEILERIMK